MPRIVTAFGLLALTFALLAGITRPASAEFFGCDDQRRSSSYSRSSILRSPFAHDHSARSRYSSSRVTSRSWSDRYR